MADPGAMTKTEREVFLADVHVGVLAVEEPGRGPMSFRSGTATSTAWWRSG
jgi:hypothetical protein